MIPFQRTDLHVDVGHTDVGSREALVFTVDVAPALQSGETLQSATAVVYDRATGSDVSSTCLSGVSNAGTKIAAGVKSLAAGKQYRLAFVYSPAAGVTREALWDLDCVA